MHQTAAIRPTLASSTALPLVPSAPAKHDATISDLENVLAQYVASTEPADDPDILSSLSAPPHSTLSHIVQPHNSFLYL